MTQFKNMEVRYFNCSRCNLQFSNLPSEEGVICSEGICCEWCGEGYCKGCVANFIMSTECLCDDKCTCSARMKYIRRYGCAFVCQKCADDDHVSGEEEDDDVKE